MVVTVEVRLASQRGGAGSREPVIVFSHSILILSLSRESQLPAGRAEPPPGLPPSFPDGEEPLSISHLLSPRPSLSPFNPLPLPSAPPAASPIFINYKCSHLSDFRERARASAINTTAVEVPALPGNAPPHVPHRAGNGAAETDYQNF
ncbi:hypothetical protein E2C01_078646 [Portunus trituberculatus]|uniref:Uncharacterized protein n=1 Tax=Portunus trituberculatus TaxID=210409 RepID=A0A5B7INE1_PORTR|nr:hypothetical protein [Portunus trituberculatus]